MHKRIILFLTVVFSILSALMMGCATAKFKFTQVTQPVMLGNMKKIGGQDIELGRLKDKIDVSINSIHRTFLEDRSNVAGNPAGIELLKRLKQSSETHSLSDTIIIDKIYFGSASSFLLFRGDVTASWIGVSGVTYEGAGNHAEQYKKKN